jgi:uncharacterized protein
MAEEPAVSAFHIMAKPTGAACNLNCRYCFYLRKQGLYPGSSFRMSDKVMESYIRQTIQAHQVPQVAIAWQGGEPTLMGLEFFRRAIDCQKKHQRPGTVIQNSIQTNGILLDDPWCEFLRENRFLVGLSLDGPRPMHDAYRVDKAGEGTFDRVMRALRLLQKHRVDFNILATVHAANAERGLEVYRFFRDQAGAQFIQFIPIVERDNETGPRGSGEVADCSVRPEQYGRFLIAVFDEWVRRDVGRMFVVTFDGLLAAWAYGKSSLCVFHPTCGLDLALEHNGDLYSCDHFVEPERLLGNILEQPLAELVGSPAQRKFGRDKQDALPRYCRQCEFLFACNGECPKNRFIRTPDGEPGLNYLCAGLKAFFRHVDDPMRMMADLIRRNRPAAEVMRILAARDMPEASRPRSIAAWSLLQEGAGRRPGRNDPCPCGSGRKFKHCHGRPRDGKGGAL